VVTVTVTLFFSRRTLLFHSTMLLYHPVFFSLTSLSPCCFLMSLLSLTCFDSFSHEPSFLVLLPLIHARSLYLFKNIVTACTFLNLNLLSSLGILDSSSLGRRLVFVLI
jgi:hypothetical protein